MTRVAIQRVVATTAKNAVSSVAAKNAVVARAPKQGVVACVSMQCIASAGPIHVVVAVAAIEIIGIGVTRAGAFVVKADNRVVAIRADNAVNTGIGITSRIAATCRTRCQVHVHGFRGVGIIRIVEPGAATQVVCAAAPFQGIIAILAMKRVVSGAAD